MTGYRGANISDRSDARRNRRLLLKAAAEVLRRSPSTASMQEIADEAELSHATAYRYFSSLDDLVAAYHEEVLDGLREHAQRSRKTGIELFEHMVRKWVNLLHTHGPIIVRQRSYRGFLERLHSGDPLITLFSEAWDAPLRGTLDELGVGPEHLESARFLHSILFDPREIIDLLKTAGLSEGKVVRRLSDAFYAATRGWVGASASPSWSTS